jgi:hypothetical protein
MGGRQVEDIPGPDIIDVEGRYGIPITRYLSGRQVEDQFGAVDGVPEGARIADIAPYETEIVRLAGGFYVLERAVGKIVKASNGISKPKQRLAQMRADKPGATCHQRYRF